MGVWVKSESSKATARNTSRPRSGSTDRCDFSIIGNVTFSATNATSVPLQLTFKDADGNVISSQYDVKISSLSTSQQNNSLPIIPIAVIVVLVFAGGWFFYRRRNKK